jgi:hypothetical protein
VKIAAAIAAALLVGGCATQSNLYAWGRYEDLIYTAYANPGSMPPERQVEALEQDYQQARANNQRMPPGWHAHLGYLYSELGKPDQARQELQTEKAAFPESAVFVDRLLANLSKS